MAEEDDGALFFILIVLAIDVMAYIIAFFIFRSLRIKNGKDNANCVSVAMAFSVFCLPVCCGLLIYTCLDDKEHQRRKDMERGTVYVSTVQPTYYHPAMTQAGAQYPPQVPNAAPYYPPVASYPTVYHGQVNAPNGNYYAPPSQVPSSAPAFNQSYDTAATVEQLPSYNNGYQHNSDQK